MFVYVKVHESLSIINFVWDLTPLSTVLQSYRDGQLSHHTVLRQTSHEKLTSPAGFILAPDLCERKNLTCSNIARIFQT